MRRVNLFIYFSKRERERDEMIIKRHDVFDAALSASLHECSNYMARDTLIAVIVLVFIAKGYLNSRGRESRGRKKKAIAPSREKKNKARVRRRVSPNFRLSDGEFSEIAVSVDNFRAKN